MSDTVDLLIKIDSINDPSMPQWGVIMMECFKNIITILNDIKNNTTEVIAIKAENIELKYEINRLSVKLDDVEQRSRNSCLLIHGVDERLGEKTDEVVLNIINEKLGIAIEDLDLQRSHRLGPMNNSRPLRSNMKKAPRPIIIRFSNYKKRLEIFKAKSKLKGQRLLITENLTQRRYSIYVAAMEKLGRANVWTNEGRVLTKMNDKIEVISKLEDLDKFT